MLQKPPGLKVRSNDGLVICRRWYSHEILFSAVFTAAITALICTSLAATLMKGELLFALVLGMLCIGSLRALYVVLAYLLNTTTITVTRGTIFVDHGPIPWSTIDIIRVVDLKQIYAKVRTENGKRPRTFIEVHALTKRNRDYVLLDNLKSAEEAVYIEQQIEHFLTIDDEPVAGEIPWQALKQSQKIGDGSNTSPRPTIGLDFSALEKIQRDLPEQVTLTAKGGDLEIRLSWLSSYTAFIFVFMLAWIGFTLLMWFGHNTRGGDEIRPYVGSLFILVDMILLYTFVANVFNVTTIVISADKVAINHAPIPWSTPKPVACSHIKQLFIRKHRAPKGGIYFTLYLLTLANKEIKLIDKWHDVEQLSALEKIVESVLGINDVDLRHLSEFEKKSS